MRIGNLRVARPNDNHPLQEIAGLIKAFFKGQGWLIRS